MFSFIMVIEKGKKDKILNREKVVKEFNVIPCQESGQKALSSEEIQRQVTFIENDLTCFKSPKFKSGICQQCSNVFS